MKLGIMKEFGLDSRYVATARTKKASTFEGHPFMVECGLSFGGEKCKEGITRARCAEGRGGWKFRWFSPLWATAYVAGAARGRGSLVTRRLATGGGPPSLANS